MKAYIKNSCVFLAIGLFGFGFTPIHKSKPTIYIIGDSTVKNGAGKGEGGLWGWGSFINQFFDSSMVNIENHALGGTSSRTFQSKGLWENVQQKIQAGDYVLLQFGHNDAGPINDDFRARGTMPGIGDESEEIDNLLTGKHEIVHTYGWYLRKVIQETKAKGGIPIVISPIPRNDWENNKIKENRDAYPKWAAEVAAQENVSFIDLNLKLTNELNILGERNVTEVYFYKRDHTHTSAKGAMLAAQEIVKELKNQNLGVAHFLLANPELKLPQKVNVLLIGDSTVADNKMDDAVGWGVVFSQYFDTMRVEVINKARGGRSSRTFYAEGLWDEAKTLIGEGDFVLIQFGHNDGGNIDKPKYRGSLKGLGDETREVKVADGSTELVHTYGWYMNTFIKETKRRGAKPIVIGSVPRNVWEGRSIETDLYVNLAKEIAENNGIPFINLHDLVADKYEKMGQEKVATFFPKDHTHTNIEGARLNAGTLAQALKKSALEDFIIWKEE